MLKGKNNVQMRGISTSLSKNRRLGMENGFATEGKKRFLASCEKAISQRKHQKRLVPYVLNKWGKQGKKKILKERS